MNIQFELWEFDNIVREAARQIEDEFVKPHDSAMARHRKVGEHVRVAIDQSLQYFLQNVARTGDAMSEARSASLRFPSEVA